MNSVKLFFIRLFELPVRRKSVLTLAKEIRTKQPHIGLCSAISSALASYGIWRDRALIEYFPEFTFENAKEKFKADGTKEFFWWIDYDDPNRMEFLDWLIKQYENDKTNLRKL